MVTPTGAAMRTSRIYFPSSANPPARSFPFARPPSAPQNTAQGGYRISSRNSSSSSAATASRASDAPDARLPFSLLRPAGQPGHVLTCPCALRFDVFLLAEQLRLSISRKYTPLRVSSRPGFCSPEDALTHGQCRTAPPSHPRGSRQPSDLCRPYVFICLKRKWSHKLLAVTAFPAHSSSTPHCVSGNSSSRNFGTYRAHQGQQSLGRSRRLCPTCARLRS